ncbi:multidrug resistance-associated protein 4-like isoform X2 [Dendronephthya gigantea]|uniref:multidrug resistance-associated protein 4-like isoform X2 n=1 Tax=Dendronephthya gigantea TaxID=151771 RepID=UPI00106DD01F|nr:multidrug resistance-associated protein 4-like isoform X2 [Dendronephthya gigantea]
MTSMFETRHPKDNANFISKIILWWIFPLLFKGIRNPLEHKDLHAIREVERSCQRTCRLEEIWRQEVKSARSLGRKPKLWRAMFRYFTFLEYWNFVPVASAYLLGDNITWYSTISLLHKLTSFNGNASRLDCFVYVYGIALGSVIKLFGQNHLHLHGAVLGVRARAAILGLLYKKVLRLSKISLDSGHVMELVCNDSQRIIFCSAEWFIPYAIKHALWCTCLVLWLLHFIGWQIIPGAVFLLALGISRLFLNTFDYKLRKGASQMSDERLGVIRETLTAMASVKLNCWDAIYENKIQKTRWQEIKYKAKRWIVMLTCYSFISCGQHLGTIITVLVLVLTKMPDIPYLNFFAMIALFRELSEKLCLCLPTSIRYITDVRTALQRMESFLQQNDHLNLEPDMNSSLGLSFGFGRVLNEASLKVDALAAKTSEFPIEREQRAPLKRKEPFSQRAKTNNTAILNDVTFEVATPGLVLVCGPVGSGKSSLLETVLDGELLVTKGVVRHSGSLAYVSETPWVFPGTIRENILFGLPYEENRYTETLRACQLEKDLKTLPMQDLAVIGEHGATVSGGQRTRIALARAVYSQADIYLLDDPLSSLDAKVAENIFRYCIRGVLANRIILLTSNGTKYYNEADHIVHLKGGKIEGQKNDMKFPDFDLKNKSEKQHEKMAAWNDFDEQKEMRPLKVEEEWRERGRVSFNVYKEYFLFGASALVLFIIAVVFLSGQGLIVLVDISASRLPTIAGEGGENFNHALLIYVLYLIAGVVLVVLGTLFIFLVLMNAAYKVHNKMVTCLLKAPVSFHAINPVGRILNRFSQDINSLDDLLPFYIFLVCIYAGPTIATVLLAIITTPLLIIPVLLALPVFYYFSKVYFTSGTDIKRLMSIAGSPIYSHFSNTMEGLKTIRVYGSQKRFTDEAFRRIDEHHRAVLCSYVAIRWFANVFSIICVSLATVVTLMVVFLTKDSLTAALGAVTILYTVNTTQMIDYVVRVTSDVNSQMTSAERVLAYTKIEPECGQDEPKTPPENWPHAGEVVFKEVSLSYYKGGADSLKNISFKINSSEKVGIAGRTGAGKSSVVAALMRLAETRGEIMIDDENIKNFNTLSTREHISVISQTPTLMKGTVRLNLDPLHKHTDAELWNVLERVKLDSVIKNLHKKLESELNIGDTGFSVGEKQL